MGARRAHHITLWINLQDQPSPIAVLAGNSRDGARTSLEGARLGKAIQESLTPEAVVHLLSVVPFSVCGLLDYRRLEQREKEITEHMDVMG